MPTVVVDAVDFNRRVGHPLFGLPAELDLPQLEKKLDDVCFEFGLEYDGLEATADGKAEGKSEEKVGGKIEGGRCGEVSPSPRLRIEVPANRYDLLCIEGLEAALRVFLGKGSESIQGKFPAYKHSVGGVREKLVVGKATESVRPFALGCIFRNVKLNALDFASFIDLQDKLHQNIGRRRTLVAIGTHDLDAIARNLGATSATSTTSTEEACLGPFRFDAFPKKGGFKFVPLTQTKEVDGEGMMELLASSYLKPYLPIIADSPVYPVILDSKSNVLSVPPIVNADFCKMSAETKNIFVEITAKDHHKAEIALDTIVAFMAEKLADPFTVEPLLIEYEGQGVPYSQVGIPAKALRNKPSSKTSCSSETMASPTLASPSLDTSSASASAPASTSTSTTTASEALSAIRSHVVPSLQTTHFTVSRAYLARVLGVPLAQLPGPEIVRLLSRMMLRAEASCDNEDEVFVECPINRRDILHPCDIAEDLGIAYGFNNIVRSSRQAVSLQDINNLSEHCRRTLSMATWRECLSFGLVSLSDAFTDLRRQRADAPPPIDNTTNDIKNITNSLLLEQAVKEENMYYPNAVRPVIVSDPKTREFECVRPSLIPGLLKTLASNQAEQTPIKLFEVGDCVVKSDQTTNCARQFRNLAALIADPKKSGLEDIHGLLDRVFAKLRLNPVYSGVAGPGQRVRLEPLSVGEDGTFLDGRVVRIVVFDAERPSEGVQIGKMGIIHPIVLENFKIPYPTSLFEINLDYFAQRLPDTDLAQC